MTTTAILEKVSVIKKYTPEDSFIANKELDALLLGLKADIQLQSTKGATAKSQVRAAIAFAKHCAKQRPDTNIAGAFIVKDGRMGICDGYTGVLYDNPIDGIVCTPDRFADDPFKLNEIMAPVEFRENEREVNLPVLAELKGAYELSKATYCANNKKKGFIHYTLLGGDVHVNSEYLIRAMELAGITGGKCKVDGYASPVYIAGNGCKLVVLPIRFYNRYSSESEINEAKGSIKDYIYVVE